MNTRIHLLYRDACNFKSGDLVIFAGEPTPELVDRLFAAMDEQFDHGFVAEQVGLENPARTDELFVRRFPDEEDDHGWTSITDRGDIEAVDDEPTDPRTFEQFVIECEAVEDWDPMVCINACGGWHDPEDAARHRGM